MMENRRALSKSENAATPVTPPARYISSNLSTPGSTFGKEEDVVILELTQRYIKAGVEGESHPQCCISFTPDKSRRHGDFRMWLPGYIPVDGIPDEVWGKDYELWRNDLKDVDLDLLSDKLERVVRDIYNTRLLIDAGNARLVLVLPSLLPHPVLSSVLQTLFERWSFPSITLLPTSATALVAAGVRSGLVVDMGWEETVVTAVYEYREVRSVRTTRAMKSLTQDVARFVKSSLDPDHCLNLELIEDLVRRVGMYIAQQEFRENANGDNLETSNITLDWPTRKSTKPVTLDALVIHKTMVVSLLDLDGMKRHDDEELPLHKLMYKCLLALPADVRGICISRLVVVGQGSEDQLLTSNIVHSLSRLIENKGWTDIECSREPKKRPSNSAKIQAVATPTSSGQETIRPEKPLVEERYIREKAKHNQPSVQGVVRQIESLGSWEGASLLTTLKVKSFVDIQRDRFLSHGLAGASRDMEVSMVQPKSTIAASRSKVAERQSWTLSGWG